MRRIVVAFAIACALTGCGDTSAYPWLDRLDAGDGVEESGTLLMALPTGLHALEAPHDTDRVLLIGAHGYASRGYEWIYPLKQLDDTSTSVYFYRWDFKSCPDRAAQALIVEIRTLLTARPELSQVRLVGHSLGGVMVTQVAKRWSVTAPIDVHVVAAPLAGVGPRRERCDVALPVQLPPNVTFSEWRTQHALDGAFKDLDQDPQVVDIPGSRVTRLASTYRDRRLGHNWSISAVADVISTSRSAQTE